MKYKIYTLICLSLLLLGVSACKHDGFTIEGTIEGGGGNCLWLEELAPEGPIFIDSIRMDADGHFKYRYNAPYLSLYNLHTTENNYIVTLPANGETIEVKGQYDNLSATYSVKGSAESALLWQLQQYTNDGSKILYALVDSVNHYEALLAAGEMDNATYDKKKAVTDSIYHADSPLQTLQQSRPHRPARPHQHRLFRPCAGGTAARASRQSAHAALQEHDGASAERPSPRAGIKKRPRACSAGSFIYSLLFIQARRAGDCGRRRRRRSC